MKENELVVKVISDNEEDTVALAQVLKKRLGNQGSVEVAKRDAPNVPGRGLDPAAAIQVIQLTLTTVGTAAAVIQALNSFKSTSVAVGVVFANPATGVTVRLSTTDADAIMHRKIGRVMRRKGLFARLLGR